MFLLKEEEGGRRDEEKQSHRPSARIQTGIEARIFWQVKFSATGHQEKQYNSLFLTVMK